MMDQIKTRYEVFSGIEPTQLLQLLLLGKSEGFKVASAADD